MPQGSRVIMCTIWASVGCSDLLCRINNSKDILLTSIHSLTTSNHSQQSGVKRTVPHFFNLNPGSLFVVRAFCAGISALEMLAPPSYYKDQNISGPDILVNLYTLTLQRNKTRSYLKHCSVFMITAAHAIIMDEKANKFHWHVLCFSERILMFEDMGKDKEPAETGPPGRRTFADLP